jgi:ribosomal protein L12E/L44/L45/RPP1/RPP2
VLNEDVAHAFMYAADRLSDDALARIERLIQQFHIEIESRLNGVVADLDRSATRIEELVTRFEQAVSSAPEPRAPSAASVTTR